MLHVKTRKRDLIDRLYALGMSISYDHVLRLLSDMANAVCEHFKETDTVCPPDLKRTVFTTAAVDNIDHNTSSTTAITSFHGTSISLIQHPNEDGERVSNSIIKRKNLSPAKTTCIAPLPSSNTNILPLSSQKQGGLKVPSTSTQCSLKGDEEAVLMATGKETEWLDDTTKHLEENKVTDYENVTTPHTKTAGNGSLVWRQKQWYRGQLTTENGNSTYIQDVKVPYYLFLQNVLIL